MVLQELTQMDPASRSTIPCTTKIISYYQSQIDCPNTASSAGVDKNHQFVMKNREGSLCFMLSIVTGKLEQIRTYGQKLEYSQIHETRQQNVLQSKYW